MTANEIHRILQKEADPTIATHSGRFFKTGTGEYGEGDQFLGIRVPVLRAFARQYPDMALAEVNHLLQSPWHEERLLALFMLVQRFKKGAAKEKQKVVAMYMKNRRYINNWDLVDSSACHILGSWLADRERAPLYRLAASKRLWDRRMAIMATLHFIRLDQFDDTLQLARILRNDAEDLIHKSVGWMLREIGKRDRSVAEDFLRFHCRHMPRTMLRYAIERFPEAQRKRYLRGAV